MSFKLLYSKRAAKDIHKLDPVIKRKLAKVIERNSKNPLAGIKKLTSSVLGQNRWRAGNYRIIFDLNGKSIEILRVGHRRDIYER